VGVQPWPGPGWDPLGDLATIKQEMNRLFETLLGQGEGRGLASDGMWVPPLDVSETSTELRVQVEVPGVVERQIAIEILGGVLTVRGDRPIEAKFQPDQIQQLEGHYGQFMRRLSLPATVDPNHVQATYRNGVLEIRLRKRPECQPRSVPIEAA